MAENVSNVKDRIFNMIPPAMLTVVVLFWGLAPTRLTENPTSILVAVCATMAVIQALEWVHERHAGWRWNWRELFTDVFYVVLGFTAIDFVSTHLAEDPLKAMKTALHIGTPWTLHLPFVAQVALIVFLIARSKRLSDVLEVISDERASLGHKLRVVGRVFFSKGP